MGNTILIFANDNGGQMNDFRNAGKALHLRGTSHNVAEKAKTAKVVVREKLGYRTNGDLRGYKGSNYEGDFRVSRIVRWPGKAAKGSESNLTDLLATTANFLGQDLLTSAGGGSFDFSPVILGKKVNLLKASVELDNL